MKLKFIGIRISFNLPCEKKNPFHTYSLAVRPFHRQFKQKRTEDADQKRMSELLYDWCEKTLHSYGLEMKNIISGTSDSGSDVKRMFTLIENASWEWCIPHIISRVCIDSFGASINKDKSKNKEAREVVDKIKKVLETVNKGTKIKEILDELNESSERYRKMLSYAPQRWQSLGRVVDRVLENWEELREAFIKIENSWLLKDYKDTILEFDAMLQQIGEVVRATQGRDIISALVQFFLLYTNLGPDKGLKLRVRDNMGRVIYNEFKVITNTQMTSAGSSVKKMLRENLENRFFNRYSVFKGLNRAGIRYVLGRGNSNDAPISIMKKYLKFSCWFDLLILLTPVKGFYDGKLLQKMIMGVPLNSVDFDSLKGTIEAKPSLTLKHVQNSYHKKLYSFLRCELKDICLRIHKNRSSDKRKKTEEQTVEVSGFSPQKRAKTTLYTNMLGLDEDSTLSPRNSDSRDGSVCFTLENIIDEELSKYFKSGLIIPEALNKDKHFDPIPQVKRIWNSDEVKKSYPHLYVAANAILGGMVSSGDLERDFNPMGDVLRGKRSSLDPALVEILMHLHLNFNMIPRKLKDIPRLTSDEIQNLTPSHLTNERQNENLRKILAMEDDELYGQDISNSDLDEVVPIEEFEDDKSSSSDEKEQ
uniref:HAT C-terminal dimerisation domain-containing protein n=1 Tax=Aplanochytrium stocchinoi TaxID=215587 RepID=A0A6S7ZVB6_9STRA|mmetsp:Transcript_27609/g.33758  ORF Transcript_27609/g.33758 Transcript_27609/m.33758 type:complete len:646 (+) Transcript_27609:59-1996(+)|eukprot:CAMPEP_0204840716 /NCGR_PEP_ID=MMETSP1346-20131115/38675_1 /ASSEMBLY_ACC=CAM_ASM_000771 /TAXON_ID=215587 /ORGANISM="Aplanochytrium stocchinoi, Strain GSBS06" /LENGTH=645 /DNA_ID=CAMNT_0051978291 /DNA_START=456 /DNA_END=2393 /DNA_ORIENTATION=+